MSMSTLKMQTNRPNRQP